MKRVLVLLPTVLAVCLAGLAGLAAAPARADSGVEVRNDRGGRDADLTYRTALTITGSGFQVVRGGFGGVYVLFGWVDDPRGGSWRPSRGGLTGRDYQYIPDAESTADSQGYLRYVAFPGSATAGEAAATLSSSGGFTVDLTVPGPVFQSVDRDGDVAEVDCREVTCGVITLGAHGVKNARNETFTPVAFDTVYDTAPDQDPSPSSDPSSDPAPGQPNGQSPDQPADPSTSPASTLPTSGPSAPTPGGATTTAGAPGVSVDRATAVAGHAMAFSARGFTPGEQVVAVLDDGTVGLGPLAAGTSGEVAGVLPLPADLEVGTHELRVSGAASGTVLTELFPVAAGDLAPVAEQAASDGPDGAPATGALVFLGLAATVLALAALALGRARLRARRARRARRTTVVAA